MKHGEINEIRDNIFWLAGAVQVGPGMRIDRNMTIVRRGDELTLSSSIRLFPQPEKDLEQLGKVRQVVKLGHAHGMVDQ